MALSAAGLSTLLQSKIKSAAGNEGVTFDDVELASFTLPVAEAVIEYVVANAEVIPTALVSAPTGGPVTGKGSLL